MLGLCCHFLREVIKPRSGKKDLVNAMEERTLQLGRYRAGKYTPAQITGTYLNNVRNLADMLPKIHASGFRHFRISSALLPLSDQVDRALWDNEDVIAELRRAGDVIRTTGMRVSTHPGQFCVLSSDSDDVIRKSIVELETHGWLFDSMGLDRSPQYAINIHGGKSDRLERLIDTVRTLPASVAKRLTLENDESAYDIVDLLQVHQATGTPVCWDSHHHVFNDAGLSLADAYDAACETWPKGVTPLQHISNTEPDAVNGSFAERRKHSNAIHYVPGCQLQALRDDTICVEVEAKGKNVAIDKMVTDFGLPK